VKVFDTGMEYKFHRYIAPYLIGSISGLLVGRMKARLMDINTNLGNVVREKTIELKMEIKELVISSIQNF